MKFRDGKKVSPPVAVASRVVPVCVIFVSVFREYTRTRHRAQKNRARARTRTLHFHSHPAIIIANASSQFRESYPRRFRCQAASRHSLVSRISNACSRDACRRESPQPATLLIRDKNYVTITGAVCSVCMCTLHDVGGSFKSALYRMLRKRCATIAESRRAVRSHFWQNNIRTRYTSCLNLTITV